MAESNDICVFHEVASPFCGIASDDLTIEVSGQTVSVIKTAMRSPKRDLKPKLQIQSLVLMAKRSR